MIDIDIKDLLIIKLGLMSINLPETVQKNLGYAPLQKIDPNTQSVAEDNKAAEDRFSQAAIPAVLTAFYRFVQSDSGAEAVLRGNNSTNWAERIFHDNKSEVIESVVSYTGDEDREAVEEKLNEIAYETVEIARENLPDNPGIKEVKLFFSDQRNSILLHLPAALKMGELLHDDTLDDNTNKMEGPVSSLMNKLGSAFSKPATTDEMKNSN